MFKITDVLEVNITAFFEDQVPQVKDPKTNYGYATKEELHQVQNTILKEIEKLRNDLSSTPKTLPKTKSAKRKK